MHGRVASTEVLTPSLVRVVLEDGDLAELVMPDATDAYINAAFRPASAAYDEVFDPQALRDTHPDDEPPARRRYTVRDWDPATHRLTLDFVVHGDSGVAGPWAAAARPGDVLVFTGPSGGYRPDPDADWHLMVGDESALPAIAAICEALGGREPAIAVIEVQDETDELPVPADVRWVHRGDAPAGGADLLAAALDGLTAPPGAHGYLMGETRAMVTLRAMLEARGIEHDAIFVKGYWNVGRPDRLAGRTPG
jgi:NADPH-dependent ferric siderophore reductase